MLAAEGEGGKGDEQCGGLADGGAVGQNHQRGMSACGTPERQGCLHPGKDQREDQNELADLGDHWVTLPSRHCPLSRSASATSLGM